MKEGLLLDRIALHAADVAPRHVQRAAVVEAHVADAQRAVGNRALVPARIAAEPSFEMGSTSSGAASARSFEGVCKVRFNRGGTLYVPWGYVGGVQCDPIEKKPFFHALPGALAYSFGMLGCDLHCGYCQNWVTSQALRDPRRSRRRSTPSPEALVARRRAAGRARGGQHLQRAADHQRVGGRGLQGARRRGLADRLTSRTATARRRCSTTSAPGSICTRWT